MNEKGNENEEKEEKLHRSLLGLHVPSSYLDFFELKGVASKPDCWELHLEERKDLIPKALKDRASVLDGFCNEINILSHSFSTKKIILVIRRRRWKPQGGGKHFSNHYNLHADGAKMTQEFVDFLKGGD